MALKTKFKKKNYAFLLFIVVVFAFFLRAYESGGTFPSNDHMDPVIISLKIHSIEFNFNSITRMDTGNFFARLLIHPVGIAQIDLTYFWSLIIFRFMRFNINEFMWTLPFIVIGSISVIAIYFLVKKITNNKAALLAAVFIAILPMHVAFSRLIGNGNLISSFFQVLIILFFIISLKTGQKKYEWIGSLILGAYIISHSLFLGIVPVIFYIFVVYSNKKDLTSKIKFAFKSIIKPRIILIPSLALLSLLLVHFIVVIKTGVSCYDILGHAFSGAKMNPGIYIPSFTESVISGTGPLIFVLILISIYFGAIDIKKMSKESILFFAGIIYLIPFMFLIPPNVTQVYAYLIHGITLITIYSAITISKINAGSNYMKSLKFLLIILIIGGTISTTLNKVQDIDTLPFLKVEQKGYGTVHPDTGAKAAGYWIRTHTPKDAVILADATGGGGIEPPIGQYYFNRKIIGKLDATIEEVYEIFIENQEKIDIIIIHPENEKEFKERMYIQFYRVAEIFDENSSSLLIYSKQKSSLSIAQLNEYNRLFDKTYNKIENFINPSFPNEEKEKMPYFIKKCSKTPLFQFYKEIGLIKHTQP